MATTFMVAIEINIVATAMPSIVSQLGGFDLYSWVFAAFLLPQAVTIPIYGKLADLYGRRRILVVGIIVFLTASLLCGLATSMPQLIGFRALQGLGGGAILPVAHTVVGDIYTSEERARMQGYIAIVWATSAIIGPALGALIVAHVDWRWVFWLNIPLGFIALAMLFAFYREAIEQRRRQIDFLGASLLMLGSGALMLALVQAATFATSVLVGLVAIAAACAVVFWRVEQRAVEPVLPPSLWRIPVVRTATIATVVVSALAMGVVTYLPVHIQGVTGHDPNMVAIGLALIAVSWSFCAGLGGRISIRTTYRRVVVGGSLLTVVGAAFLAMLPPSTDVAVLIAGAVVIAMGLGFTSSTYVVAVQTNVSWQIRGTATSAVHFARTFGQALGAALFGMVINLSLLKSGTRFLDVDTIIDPARRRELDSATREGLVASLGEALTDVYLVASVVAVLALLLGLRIPRGLNPGSSLGSQNPG